jgi:hypothetical protein
MENRMTPSEKIVTSLCKKAFLSLWTMANPVKEKFKKELCDALIVFNENVIIISVKEIIYKETEDIQTGLERWNKAAIEKSIKQLKGAKRFLDSQSTIRSKEHNIIFNLPNLDIRRYHLLTVSLGCKRKIPISIPMEDDLFVHFVDEYSLDVLFRELDTASDFIEYLEKKEALYIPSKKIVMGAEEDILGYYLWNNRSFPEKADGMFFSDDIWKNIQERPEFNKRKELNQISYFWDKIIEEFIAMRDPKLNSIFGFFDDSNENVEKALRVLAKECRFSRRILSQAFFDFQRDKNIASRVIQSYQKDVYYVFLKKPINFDRNDRIIELLARCLIVRDKINYNAKIVGLATEDDISKGHSFDWLFYEKEILSDEDLRNAKSAINDLDLFKTPRFSTIHADEYPTK